jgi:hypothetical protein
MIRRRDVVICTVGVALMIVLAMGSACMDERASEAIAAGGTVPIFEVDPLWPKPLPNHWILGSTIGVSVDSRDHIWIIHRQTTFNEANELGATLDPPTTECCIPAPNILEFDMEGNLVNSWGGPGDGYDWPQSNHGITVDAMDNVWIGGNGADDSHILKFTRDGQFLMQIGQPRMRAGSNDREHFWRVAEVTIDAEENEAYVADGYGNRRIAVLDASTGEFLRHWGAYGNTPDDSPLPAYSPDAPPAQQFRSPVHCAQISHDGLVYVCDRAGDRIQVFQRDGTYVTEGFVAPETLGSGSAWDLAFSRDPEQRFLYLADGSNKKIHVLERATLEVLTTFGDGGRQPGQFYGVHSVATDSQGNLYTTETYEGKRVQKFVYMGLGSAPRDQGVVWPTRD